MPHTPHPAFALFTSALSTKGRVFAQTLLPLLLICACAVCGGEDAAKKLNTPVVIGKLPAVVNESSGLVKGRRHAGKEVYWTHNDSGDSSRIFAVDLSGKLLRTVVVPHAQNADWEEITMDEKGRLIVCDIGDNNRDHHKGKRPGVVLYRMAEPDAFDETEKIKRPEVFHFHYPEGTGPFDAEGACARGGNVYLFTKQPEGTTLYKLPMPENAPEGSVAMTPVLTTKAFNIITSAALSDDGKHLAILNYVTLMVIDLPEPFEKLKPNAAGELPLFDYPRRSENAFLGQTEAVAWDGEDLVLTNEGGGILRSKK